MNGRTGSSAASPDPARADEAVLDVLLAEVLGGETPPDLSARILARLRETPPDRATTDSARMSHLVTPPDGMTPSREQQTGRTEPRSVTKGRLIAPAISRNGTSLRSVPRRRAAAIRPWAQSTAQPWVTWLAGGAVVAASFGLGWLVLRPGDVPRGPAVAQQDGPTRPDPASPATDRQTTAETGRPTSTTAPGDRAVPDTAGLANPSRTSVAPPARTAEASNSLPARPDFGPVRLPDSPFVAPATRETRPFRLDPPKATVEPVRPDRLLAAASDRSSPLGQAATLAAATRIDDHLRSRWKAAGVTASPRATDGEWARRVFLHLVGRVPTLDELGRFRGLLTDFDRLTVVTDLSNRREFAEYWGLVLANNLVGRHETVSPADRSVLERFFADAIAEDRPWDEVVRELVTATGHSAGERPDANPAVHYLLSAAGGGVDADGRLADRGERLAARVGRALLGRDVSCVRCHDHPTSGWKQTHFWELASFFQQVRLRRSESGWDVRDADFSGDNRDPGEARLYYEAVDGRLLSALPAFGPSDPVPADGRLAVVDRRKALAERMLRSPDLDANLVNRVWERMLGTALGESADAIGDETTAHDAVLLEKLSESFRRSNRSIRELVRTVALTEAFARSSRPAESQDGKPRRTPSSDGKAAFDAEDERALRTFARYRLRSMTPTMAFLSLRVAAGQSPDSAYTEAGRNAYRAWMRRAYPPQDTDEEMVAHPSGAVESFDLLSLGDRLVEQAVEGPKAWPARFAQAKNLPPAQKFERLFLAAVARPPSPDEQAFITKLLQNKPDDLAESLRQIGWGLIHSNEFLMDH